MSALMSFPFSVQGDRLPAGRVLCGADPCPRQSVQLGPDGEVHVRRLPRHPAPRSVAVGGLRRQPEIQHQVPQEVPRSKEGQQRPQGSDGRPQHQRWNPGERSNQKFSPDQNKNIWLEYSAHQAPNCWTFVRSSPSRPLSAMFGLQAVRRQDGWVSQVFPGVQTWWSLLCGPTLN